MATPRSVRGATLVDEAATALLAEALAGNEVRRTPRVVRAAVGQADPGVTDRGRRGGVIVIDDVTERARSMPCAPTSSPTSPGELKTPVGALSVLAETLADADDPDDVRRLSGKVMRESDRLSRTIDDLLALSRIELGGEVVRQPIDLEGLLSDATERIVPFAERHRVSVVVQPIDSVREVLGDRRQLASAVSNLVENAVKYTESGGRVEVRAESVEGGVDLVVSDTGIGIPEPDLDRIFERFYRVDRARSRETGGTGLGLSIVRHVAENHGGRVSVRSAEGEGSEFRLFLPQSIDVVR
ncbi:MAG: ATP-binding protein [Ilumatobacteraceae bacterium]